MPRRPTVNLTVTNGKAYDEPFSRLQGNIAYTNQSVRVTDLRLNAGASSLELTASSRSSRGQFRGGPSAVPRAQQPDSTGQPAYGAAGEGTGSPEWSKSPPTARPHCARTPPPLFSTLNANIGARGLALNKKPLGDLTATAETTRHRKWPSPSIRTSRSSDDQRQRPHGAQRRLSGRCPGKFRQCDLLGLECAGSRAAVRTFDASLDGQVSVTGPLTRTEELRGTLQLTKLEAHSVAGDAAQKPRVNLELHNRAPIVAALDRGVVTVRSAAITGPSTNSRSAEPRPSCEPGALNLRVDGNVKLEVLEAINPDIFSSGGSAAERRRDRQRREAGDQRQAPIAERVVQHGRSPQRNLQRERPGELQRHGGGDPESHRRNRRRQDHALRLCGLRRSGDAVPRPGQCRRSPRRRIRPPSPLRRPRGCRWPAPRRAACSPARSPSGRGAPLAFRHGQPAELRRGAPPSRPPSARAFWRACVST